MCILKNNAPPPGQRTKATTEWTCMLYIYIFFFLSKCIEILPPTTYNSAVFIGKQPLPLRYLRCSCAIGDNYNDTFKWLKTPFWICDFYYSNLKCHAFNFWSVFLTRITLEFIRLLRVVSASFLCFIYNSTPKQWKYVF